VARLRRGIGARNRPFAALTRGWPQIFSLKSAGSARWENILATRGRPVCGPVSPRRMGAWPAGRQPPPRFGHRLRKDGIHDS